MNSNIFKIIILCLCISCKSRHVENRYEDNRDGINGITRDFQYFKKGKKSGVYIYTKLNFRYTLKKGKLNGEMSLIKQKDTLYFCYYNKNKPIGKYINKLYLEKNTIYRLIMTMSPAIIIDGEGIFNTNHQKEGHWQENENNGYYKNGLKNGYWEERYTNDIANEISYVKKGYYKNGLKDSIWITEEYSELERKIKTEFFIKDSIISSSTKTVRNY